MSDWIYDVNDWHCFDPKCAAQLDESLDEIVWLCDDTSVAYPFHKRCAEGPWPMSEVEGPPR
jgi:hypothetical protein